MPPIPPLLVLAIKRQILNIFDSVYQMGPVGYVWKLLRKCHFNRMTRWPPSMRWHPGTTTSRSCVCCRSFPSTHGEFALTHIFSSISLITLILIPTLPLWGHRHKHNGVGWVPSVRTGCFQTGMSSVHADKFKLNTGILRPSSLRRLLARICWKVTAEHSSHVLQILFTVLSGEKMGE